MSDKPLCRHCGAEEATRARGLCASCYYTPGVREQYPADGKRTRRGIIDFFGRTPDPEPTKETPGTPEKVAVLAERARLGQSLWNCEDAGGPVPLPKRERSRKPKGGCGVSAESVNKYVLESIYAELARTGYDWLWVLRYLRVPTYPGLAGMTAPQGERVLEWLRGQKDDSAVGREVPRGQPGG